MTLRLAGGVVPGSARRVWITGPAGAALDATNLDLAPGTPVAIGRRSVGPNTAALAVKELTQLVAAGGAIVAGAEVDLGHGFRSARVEGGAGDRRDAVVAALMVPTVGDRLLDRKALLVALFGPDATKPLGAAAQLAIDENRWSVLRFAVAASDALGPEQLVNVLALRAPDGVDPFPDGLASVVGAHLTRVLTTVSRPRRLALVTDLWQRVCDHGSLLLRQDRLRASQGRQDRTDEMIARYRRYEEDELARLIGADATVLEAARWRPSASYWLTWANRVLADAMAATVLARLAVAAVDHGLDVALARHWHEIEAASTYAAGWEATMSARVVPGLTGLPARPGSYLRDILGRVRVGEPLRGKSVAYVTSRLARARAYGTVVFRAIAELLPELDREDSRSVRMHLDAWASSSLTEWRGRVGYFSPDRAGVWEHVPLLAAEIHGPTLAERLRAEPDRPVVEVETIGDLLWYAELADALAQLDGHPAAVVTAHRGLPDIDHPEPPDEPLVPRPDSVPLLVAGAAQLVDLGGQVPPRCRGWSELVSGLLTGAAIAEALTGVFVVPAAVATADATILPGTTARIEVAHTGRQLADWSDYMGNCVAGPYYVDSATAGRTVLIALRAPDGRILVNAELRPTARRWQLGEIRARFNEDPDPELLQRVREWVDTLAVAPTTVAQPVVAAKDLPLDEPARRPGRLSPAATVVRDLGSSLDELAATAVASSMRAAQVLATLTRPTSRRAASRNPADPHSRADTHDSSDPRDSADPRDALVALRRAKPAELVRMLRQALAATGDANALWQATADRPLSRAVASMPQSTVDRLTPLLVDAPLPGSLRTLARLPHVAVARTIELVALRLRLALGVLLRQDAPELARAIQGRPDASLVRAVALTVTSWSALDVDGAVTVVSPRRRVRLPGFPESSLKDERWLGAWPDAVELGATMDNFWDRITAQGLLLPSSWLGAGGWTGLWSRTS